jgi:hypothetical protein
MNDEKRKIFDQNGRAEGSFYVAYSNDNNDIIADGCLLVDGQVYTDAVTSTTANGPISLLSPLNLTQYVSIPNVPPIGFTQLYTNNSGNVVIQNNNASLYTINPLKFNGDVLGYQNSNSTRIPIGTSEQSLQVLGTSVMWNNPLITQKTQTQESDSFFRYLLLQNDFLDSSLLTGSLVSLNFPLVKRLDSDTFSITNHGLFVINVVGQYQISVTIGVGQYNDSFSDISNVVFFIQYNSGGGWITISGSQTFGMIIPNSGNHYTSLSTEVFLNVASSTQIRILVHEINTSFGNLVVKGSSSSIFIQKILFSENDSSELFSVCGTANTPQTLTGSLQKVNQTTIETRTNLSDSLTNDALVFSTSGLRHVFGKVTFSSTNLPNSGTAHIRIFLSLNGSVINSTIAESVIQCTSTGIQIWNSMNTMVLQYFSSGDQLTLQAEIVYQSASALIVLQPDSCSLNSVLYSNNNAIPSDWLKFDLSLDSLVNISNSQFLNIPFDNVNVQDSNYTYNTLFSGTIGVALGGTYIIYVKSSILNNAATNQTSGIRILTGNSTSFYQESSRGLVTLPAGYPMDVYVSDTMYMNPNSLIIIQVLGGNTLQLIPDTTQVILYKLENTVSNYVGNSPFGTSYNINVDSSLVTSTSTVLIPRLITNHTFIYTGNYRISYSFDYDMSSAGILFNCTLKLDNTIVDTVSIIPDSVGFFKKISNFVNVSISSGSRNISLNFSVGTNTVYIATQNVQIEFFRIA